jgi:hypothetical protein
MSQLVALGGYAYIANSQAKIPVISRNIWNFRGI